MTALAPTLEAYFTQRLIGQRQASPNTVAAYRDAWRLVLSFATQRTGKQPSQLDIADLDAPFIGEFLHHLETERRNSVRTRNARLAAKRCDRAIVTYLDDKEADALVAAPDRSRWSGRRDHALLVVALQTGLRVSELTGLRNQDVELRTGPHVRCWGKGRKQRATPIRPQTVSVLRTWMKERAGRPEDPLFPTSRGTPLSRDAVAARVAKHTATAARHQKSLANKRVTPHVARHSCAMALLRAGVDRAVLALWLGHEQVKTTDIYTHADLTIKQQALARTTPPNVRPGRYRPPDRLLAFLQQL